MAGNDLADGLLRRVVRDPAQFDSEVVFVAERQPFFRFTDFHSCRRLCEKAKEHIGGQSIHSQKV